MKRTMMIVPALAAAFASLSVFAADGQGERMARHMKEMQAQMEEIRQATDPVKRDELIAAHMKNMRDGMREMHGMDGGSAGCMGMMGGMQGQPGQSPGSEKKAEEHGHGH